MVHHNIGRGMAKLYILLAISALVISMGSSTYAEFEEEGVFIVDYEVPELPSRVARNIPVNHGLEIANGGKRYFVSKTSFKKSWQGANDYCKGVSMQLISLDTNSKMNRMKKIFDDYDEGHSYKVWTSGTDTGHETNFKWASTGMFLQATMWGEDQPDNEGGDEHCIAASFKHKRTEDVKWFDMECDKKLMFICEAI